jgi:hypothetical protein
VRRQEGKAALQDARCWPVSADRRDDSARLGDYADARPQVAALVTAPPVVDDGCSALAGPAKEVLPRVLIVPTLREYIADNGFVGFADLCQPGD